jgi:hypothetical protein
VADPQATEGVQVRGAAFDDPPLAAESGAVLAAAASDHRFDPAPPQQAAVLVVVEAAIGEEQIGLPEADGPGLPLPGRALRLSSSTGNSPGARAVLSSSISSLDETSVTSNRRRRSRNKSETKMT